MASDQESLGDHVVHVWTTRPDSIADPELLAAYEGLLTAAEGERRQRFLFERNRHEFLVTRALVRTVLSRYAGVAPQDWRFVANERGRPEIDRDASGGGGDLRFNLSHTDGFIACAVTRGRDVGVDVEAVDRRAQTVEIADRFFSRLEVEALRGVPAAGQRERFFTYWTLKESYIKARGLGLAIPLDQFSFHVDERPIRISFDPRLKDDPADWQFELFEPTARHRMALGVRRGRQPDVDIAVDETVPLQS